MPRKSRYNPAHGFADFWTEIRRPRPYRGLFLALSALPAALILYAALGTTVYGEPERPKITYITTLDPARSDAEIMAENRANQEIKDLRTAAEERVARRKRDMYKALGKATGMDVEEIERKAEAERAAEAAAEALAQAEQREKTASASESAGQ